MVETKLNELERKIDDPMTKDELVEKIKGILRHSKENSITAIMIKSVLDTYDYGQEKERKTF